MQKMKILNGCFAVQTYKHGKQKGNVDNDICKEMNRHNEKTMGDCVSCLFITLIIMKGKMIMDNEILEMVTQCLTESRLNRIMCSDEEYQASKMHEKVAYDKLICNDCNQVCHNQSTGQIQAGKIPKIWYFY